MVTLPVRLIAAIHRRLGNGSRAATMAHVMGLRTLALAANVCTGLLSAAVLGPDGRGEQAALISAPQFLAAIATLGLHASLIYNIKADPDRRRRYFGCALLLAGLAGLTATAVGWALLPEWLHRFGPSTVQNARLLLLITPFTVLGVLLIAILEVHARFDLSNRTIYLQGLSTLAILALLWRTGEVTPTAAALAYLLPSLPALAYLARRAFALVPPVATLERPIRQRLLHYGLRFYGIDLLGTVSANLDQLVIVAMLPQAAVGLYVVAQSLSRVLSILQGAITSVLFPSIAARADAEVIESVARTMRIAVLFNVAAAVVLAAVGPLVLQVLYGSRFAGAVHPFRILLFETIVSNAARILYQAFSGTGRPGVVSVIEGIGVSASLAAMLVVVPHFGTVGAACCVLFASSLRLLGAVACLPFILRAKMPRLLPGPADLAAIVDR